MRGYIKLAGTAERKGEGGGVQIHVLFFKSFAFIYLTLGTSENTANSDESLGLSGDWLFMHGKL